MNSKWGKDDEKNTEIAWICKRPMDLIYSYVVIILYRELWYYIHKLYCTENCPIQTHIFKACIKRIQILQLTCSLNPSANE